MSNLKSDLEGVKDRIENLGDNLDLKLEVLQGKEEKWKKLDEEATRLKENQTEIVKFNVSGELFATRVETLLRVKDTLFYKIVLSKKFDLSKEIFIDRSNKIFGYLLDYLRYGKLNYTRFNTEELEELKTEADYYELVDIVSHLEERLKEPVFINYTFSGTYNSGGNIIGTNKLEDINDRNLGTGICAITPGWILFELNYEFEIDKVDIGGFTGNTTYWASSNGSGASILISKDNINWTTVGTIPSNYSNSIVSVPFSKIACKYLKFQHSSYLGLGYVHVSKAN
jgi:hypothetical protein